jgi:hypothetical protein
MKTQKKPTQHEPDLAADVARLEARPETKDAPPKPKTRKQFIDPNDPERAIDWVAKRQRCEARQLSENCWLRIGWLGELFYRAVANEMLADPVNFNEQGYPTDEAMERIKTIVGEIAANMLDESVVGDEEVFRRDYLQHYHDTET